MLCRTHRNISAATIPREPTEGVERTHVHTHPHSQIMFLLLKNQTHVRVLTVSFMLGSKEPDDL